MWVGQKRIPNKNFAACRLRDITMESTQRRILALLMSLMLGLASLPASAEDPLAEPTYQRPGGASMLVDAVIARPGLLVLTAGGTVLFLATLPFSLLGGNAGEAGKALVVGPAKATFFRCLGCTKAQDEWNKNQVSAE
jgi:hypothetical protein